MYAGQLEMISFFSVADTSFAKHVAGSCWAPETEKNGSFSAARLAPRKAAPPTPLNDRTTRDSSGSACHGISLYC